MEIVVPISNDPLNNFSRTAKMLNFTWPPDDEFIKLDILVSYNFSQKGSKGTSRIKDYQVQLICDNNSTVDPKTGEFVLVDDDGFALSKDPVTGDALPGVGQYDFYVGLAQAGPIDIIGLIKMLIARADVLKRFDI